MSQNRDMDYSGALAVYERIVDLKKKRVLNDGLDRYEEELLERLERMAELIDKAVQLAGKMLPVLEKQVEEQFKEGF